MTEVGKLQERIACSPLGHFRPKKRSHYDHNKRSPVTYYETKIGPRNQEIFNLNTDVALQMPNSFQCGPHIKNATEAQQFLKPLTSRDFSDDVIIYNVITVLRETLEFAYSNRQLSDVLLLLLDKILDVSSDILRINNSSLTLKIISRLLLIIEKYIANVNWFDAKNMNETLNNVEIFVEKWQTNPHQQKLKLKTAQHRVHSVTFQSKHNVATDAKTFTAYEQHPPNKLQQQQQFVKLLHNSVIWVSAIPQWSKLQAEYFFLIITTINLFGAVSICENDYNYDSYCTLCKQTATNLSWPSRLYRCASWNATIQSWTVDEVETLTNNDEQIVCCSNIMSYLAIVQDSTFAQSVNVRDDVVMAMMSLVCFLVSILSNLAVTVYFATFNSFNRQEYGQIILQFCVCMAMMDACLLITYNHNVLWPWTENFCTPISTLANFFTVAGHTWFACLVQFVFSRSSTKLVTAVPSASSVNVVGLVNSGPDGNDCVYERNGPKSFNAIGRKAFAVWGLAFLQLIVSAALNAYGFVPNSSKCWDEGADEAAIWATLIAPVYICLLTSSLWCGLLFWRYLPCYRFAYERPKYGAHELNKTASFDVDDQFPTDQVFGIITLKMLLLISWIIYTLSASSAFHSKSPTLQKCHCVLSSMNGFTSFLLFALRNAVKNDKTMCLKRACCFGRCGTQNCSVGGGRIVVTKSFNRSSNALNSNAGSNNCLLGHHSVHQCNRPHQCLPLQQSDNEQNFAIIQSRLQPSIHSSLFSDTLNTLTTSMSSATSSCRLAPTSSPLTMLPATCGALTQPLSTTSSFALHNQSSTSCLLSLSVQQQSQQHYQQQSDSQQQTQLQQQQSQLQHQQTQLQLQSQQQQPQIQPQQQTSQIQSHPSFAAQLSNEQMPYCSGSLQHTHHYKALQFQQLHQHLQQPQLQLLQHQCTSQPAQPNRQQQSQQQSQTQQQSQQQQQLHQHHQQQQQNQQVNAESFSTLPLRSNSCRYNIPVPNKIVGFVNSDKPSKPCNKIISKTHSVKSSIEGKSGSNATSTATNNNDFKQRFATLSRIKCKKDSKKKQTRV
ncbi:hypothetical protein HELRODRAFT_190335 [Helobdella robusta]|uniref:G-protein coupled receptors family 2 profile 2 domain-containing protein n=1 Tax=Helobdella robusta TaxID=6412 RepID=T1FRX0_HELRO|nr:hypothetical protein HELRODRAFT_190335 [Helobdella robusta]ESO09942.1 hypothetical protein HELRODRAFT_190335 [Helobdella robusta]